MPYDLFRLCVWKAVSHGYFNLMILIRHSVSLHNPLHSASHSAPARTAQGTLMQRISRSHD